MLHWEAGAVASSSLDAAPAQQMTNTVVALIKVAWRFTPSVPGPGPAIAAAPGVGTFCPGAAWGKVSYVVEDVWRLVDPVKVPDLIDVFSPFAPVQLYDLCVGACLEDSDQAVGMFIDASGFKFPCTFC